MDPLYPPPPLQSAPSPPPPPLQHSYVPSSINAYQQQQSPGISSSEALTIQASGASGIPLATVTHVASEDNNMNFGHSLLTPAKLPHHHQASQHHHARQLSPREQYSPASPSPSKAISSKSLTNSSHQTGNANQNHQPVWQFVGETAISDTIGNDPGLCALLLTGVSVILIVLTMPFSLFFCVKVVQEYERAVIFRLGRLTKGGAKGPGIFFIIPCIDTYSKVDLRTVSFDVPPQEILSKDSVTVAVDAVVYYRISNATIAVSNVEDYGRSTRLLAATTLRNVLGTKNLSEILSERESISHVMQSSLDEATDPWGVKVERVEIKDARLPVQLQRAMATEAEAAREARAKVIAAEGEQRASRALKEAAEVIHDTPAALHLRYLQTLNSIAAEKNSTIVFPLPIDIFSAFLGPNKKASKD
ncbi:band 7 protein AGAP004871-like isoform X1 [Brevipalpus obovatus]|uniref:band 7 protein AGAP004871-like isoform X1 n=1 Tax=Brevipalpus obovatus TaxID=246614 RepID=UPI003D9E063B